jgi:hypothetical protein
VTDPSAEGAARGDPPRTDPFGRDERLRDFRNFLCLAWRSLALPDPTPLQYSIAHWMQHGPDRSMVQALRGVGKSFIACAFAVWTLYWNPDENVLIVSASKTHADDNSTFILQLIDSVPGCAFMSPEGRERHSKIAFDVGPAKPSKQPSVKSAGIFVQLTGSRAGLIISDDIESLNNSITDAAREKLKSASAEYEAIIKPGGRILFLGTPQTEDTIYNELADRGYEVRVWPAEVPDARLAGIHGPRLAPEIRALVDRGAAPGTPTEPSRFGEMELEKRRLGYGTSQYAMQFLLDTTVSDENRYPLKLHDLIVTTLDPDLCPERLLWTNDPTRRRDDLQTVGLRLDRFFGPAPDPGAQMRHYQGAVMYVDPAGTGKDETAFTVLKQLHGLLLCPECTGIPGGYSDGVMVAIAEAAKAHKVGLIKVEANFGDGMFSKLLQPHLQRIYPCTVEEVKVSTQKERRILDTLEPVMNQHRLVFDARVIERDGHRDRSLPQEQAYSYRLFYQMTRITRERGCLAHDDRLDSLAGAVAHFVNAVGQDAGRSLEASRRKALDEELRHWFDNAIVLNDVRPRPVPAFGGNRGMRTGPASRNTR